MNNDDGLGFARIPPESAFLGDIFFKYQFPIKFPIIAVPALRQDKGPIKNGF